MGRRSSILGLPAHIRTKVDRLIMGGASDLDITAKANELLAAEGRQERVSKSAVNRYAKGLRDALGAAASYPALQDPQGAMWLVLAELRQLREAVDALRSTAGQATAEGRPS